MEEDKIAKNRVLKKKRGVYYTPEPIVNFIVRAVDDCLKMHFDVDKGLASSRVEILEPAVGTGNFLVGIIKEIYKSYFKDETKETWSKYVKDSLLPRINAYDIMEDALDLCEKKVVDLLEETGCDSKDIKLNLHHINTLDSPHISMEKLK